MCGLWWLQTAGGVKWYYAVFFFHVANMLVALVSALGVQPACPLRGSESESGSSENEKAEAGRAHALSKSNKRKEE